MGWANVRPTAATHGAASAAAVWQRTGRALRLVHELVDGGVGGRRCDARLGGDVAQFIQRKRVRSGRPTRPRVGGSASLGTLESRLASRSFLRPINYEESRRIQRLVRVDGFSWRVLGHGTLECRQVASELVHVLRRQLCPRNLKQPFKARHPPSVRRTGSLERPLAVCQGSALEWARPFGAVLSRRTDNRKHSTMVWPV